MEINKIGLSGINSVNSKVNDKTETDFRAVLNEQLNKLNDKQVEADNYISDLISGNDVDLHQVMIATEEARLSLELAVQIRNKVVEAYKELNNMQL
ncbi:flagellar hook-basal body complex protein FliE [Soehngenia longivitae]|uniref:Flagellar hook-basal body complex protein FliE n=1 Tax=Soehngenia longivitae TaxID=2562294 RepID=A0A4Z0D3K7_9FIRM|nr:flagellar hook-basal body complex protein FliE [Soehngenia longivitae]TFZ39915.1 flagellar hook-basal body complex protein FliE [Soehngenia longivitae]